MKTDQPNEAIVELKKALELGGNQHKSLEYIALCYKEIGEYGKAVYYLRKAVSKKPDSVLTRLHLAECYLSIGKNATAKRIVTEALSDIPPGLVFSEIQACAKKIVLRELPNKSSIMPLLEAYYSRKITEFEQTW